MSSCGKQRDIIKTVSGMRTGVVGKSAKERWVCKLRRGLYFSDKERLRHMGPGGGKQVSQVNRSEFCFRINEKLFVNSSKIRVVF